MEGELDDITLKVETVSKPEKVHSMHELDPDRYGIIVRGLQNAEGVLLPQCEGINTIDEQVKLAMEKGNIPPAEKKNLEIFRFNIDIFHWFDSFQPNLPIFFVLPRSYFTFQPKWKNQIL